MSVKQKEGFDLLGNTVAVPTVKAVSDRIVAAFIEHNKNRKNNRKTQTKSLPV
jgi:hypothetical protein